MPTEYGVLLGGIENLDFWLDNFVITTSQSEEEMQLMVSQLRATCILSTGSEVSSFIKYLKPEIILGKGIKLKYPRQVNYNNIKSVRLYYAKDDGQNRREAEKTFSRT